MIAFIRFCRDDGSEIFSAAATSFENIRARLDGWENWVNKETNPATHAQFMPSGDTPAAGQDEPRN